MASSFGSVGYRPGVGGPGDMPIMGQMGAMGDPLSVLQSTGSLGSILNSGTQSMPSPELISEESVIEQLRPGSDKHAKVLKRLNA